MMPGKYRVIVPQGGDYWGHKKGDIVTFVKSFDTSVDGGYFTPLVGKTALDAKRGYLQCEAREVERIPDELQGESDEFLRLYYSL